MEVLRTQILKHCFERYEGVLGNGEPTNNRLNMEIASHVPELRTQIAKGMGRLVMSCNPGFVSAVSEDARWIAQDIADYYQIDLVRLDEDLPTGQMKLASEEDREKCVRHASGVLVSDFFNTFATAKRALKVFELHRRLSATYAVWDRGFTKHREPLPIKHKALVSYTIPAMLPADSMFWDYADRRGK